MNQKISALWCDRNVDFLGFKDLISELNYLEVTTFEDCEEALLNLETHDYKLVISGNKDAEGLRIFNKLNGTGKDFQFLLFTGDLDSDLGPYLMMRNFNFYDKTSFKTDYFLQLISNLIDKSVQNDLLTEKLKAIREHFNFSYGELAALTRNRIEDVISYEASDNVPSRYIVTLCNKLRIRLELFETLSLNQFRDQLVDESIFLKGSAI